MPSWNELLQQFTAVPEQDRDRWLLQQMQNALTDISNLRQSRNVIFYGSAFLQKPQAPSPSLIITHEDLNGLMSVIHGMDCKRELTLILHTPGGVTNAAESFVSYLRAKFSNVEVVIPAFAMSAGTMISLACNRLIMGRQSQLGPIDPQFSIGSRSMSARAIVDQFEMAKADISSDIKLAHAWAPILQSIGPSLLKEAMDAIDYGTTMVQRWLELYAFQSDKEGKAKAAAVAQHFSDSKVHKSHGRRIGRDEVRAQGLVVEDLEDNQKLQEATLTMYHLFTLIVEKSPAAKLITRGPRMANMIDHGAICRG